MRLPGSIFFLLQDVPQLYGAERVTLDLIQALSEKLPVKLWLIGEQRLGEQPGALLQAAEAAGIAVERFPVTGRFSRSLVRTLRARLRETPGSVIHTVGYKAHLHALAAARGGVARTGTTIHGWLVRPEIKERFYEWLEVRALRHDDAVICLTSFYEQRLLASGVQRARLRRIPTGLRADQLPSLAELERTSDTPFTIALIGRLSWEKNHDLLLRAAAKLRRYGLQFRLVLAGDGPERGAIETKIRELFLEDCVEMPGYLAMSELLPRIHAVALCSRIENLPLSLLEAMAWGKPVVATSVGGVPDIVVDGQTGFLVPDDDEETLADRLLQLIRNSNLAEEMGRAGRVRIEERFKLEHCVEQHLDLYSSLVQ